MKLTEQLYFYPWQGRANNCNSYLLKGDVTILFDPGHIYNDYNENCIDALKGQIKADGISVSDVDLVLCTHCHPDHVESAGVLREEYGAKLGTHPGDDFFLEALGSHFASRTGKELPGLKPDYSLEEGRISAEISGEHHIEVIHTPGHSPGCVCFLLPEQKALVSGDTVFKGSIGRTDLPGGDMATLGKSVDKLISKTEGVELFLPGHMGHVSGARSVRDNLDRIKSYFFS